MKTTITRLIAPAALIVILLLAACQSIGLPLTGGTGSANNGTVQAPTPEPSATLRPTLIPTLAPTPTATQVSPSGLAESTAQNYFDALSKGDFNQAAQWVSTFSLTVFGLTRGDAADAIHTNLTNGTRWSSFSVRDSRVFDNQTILVHVQYTLSDAKGANQKDEFWPMRQEGSQWRYNWSNLIDYHTLEVDAQTTAGITIQPTEIRRYTDHIQLLLLIQNRTNDPIVFGQVNEVLGAFNFQGQTISAEKTQIVVDALRSKPDAELIVNGLYNTYPDTVTIRQWKNYNVKPWYVFQLQ